MSMDWALDLAHAVQRTAVASIPIYHEVFIASPQSWLFFVLVPLYILLQPVCKRLAASTGIYQRYKPYWKILMITYNVGLAIFSLVCAVAMTNIVLHELPAQGFHESNFQHAQYKQIVWLFFLSKFVEFVDTFFLLLQGKDVSLLQWLHHIGAPLNVGLLYYTQDPGAHLFIILNGFIHTLLYIYYALTISGVKVAGKWVLTALQIGQFNVGFYIYTFFLKIPAYTNSPRCLASHLFTWSYVSVVELLFLDFFAREYLFKARGSKPAQGAGGRAGRAKAGLISSHSSNALLAGDEPRKKEN